MASRRPSTREHPQGTLVTPILDPEEIIRRARASLRQTTKDAREDTLGILRGISVFILNLPAFQSLPAETYNSWEFIFESENFRVEESSCTTACLGPILGDSTEINPSQILS